MEKFSCYERVFNHLDTNGDGKISPLDLLNRIAAVTGEKLSVVETEMVVASFDWNGDGLLGLEELGRFVEEGEKTEELKEAFEMYVMEGLGVITAASLRRMLSRLGESRSVDDCKRMIAKFDINGDGALCFDEFRVMMYLR